MNKTLRAIVLYTDGKYEEVKVKDTEDYQKYVNGSIQLLPFKRGYINPNIEIKKKDPQRFNLSCYVNEEGMIRDLAVNPWTGFLISLGAIATFDLFIYGNALLLSENKQNGNDTHIDQYIVDLVKEYYEVEDDEDFFLKLEELNNPSIKKKVEEEKKKVEEKQYSTDINQNIKKKRKINNNESEKDK